jgi:hypothetical protein
MQKHGSSGRRARGVRRFVLVGLVALLASAGAARADEYDPQPVGFMIDYLILRPAHWVGSHEPWRSMFGHTD